MASGNLSPRQKMINMMYLVLTALLALNVSKEVLNSSDLITKVNCPSEDEIGILKDNTIIIGMLNPSKNKNRIDKIIQRKIMFFFS